MLFQVVSIQPSERWTCEMRNSSLWPLKGSATPLRVPPRAKRIRIERDGYRIAHLSDARAGEIEALVVGAGVLVVGADDVAQGPFPSVPAMSYCSRSSGPNAASVSGQSIPADWRSVGDHRFRRSRARRRTAQRHNRGRELRAALVDRPAARGGHKSIFYRSPLLRTTGAPPGEEALSRCHG
jgi:hypothetical protein